MQSCTIIIIILSLHLYLNSDDGTLSMALKGDDYYVDFVRCKTQTQYRWKESDWVLAVYENVLETEDIPWGKCLEKPTDIEFRKPKIEIEVL